MKQNAPTDITIDHLDVATTVSATRASGTVATQTIPSREVMRRFARQGLRDMPA
jgi:hypothetical protein